MRCATPVIVLSLLCLYGSVVSSDDDYTPPKFCGDAICPRYKVLETNDEYELRAYVLTKWALTRLNTTMDKHFTARGYMRLANYIGELVDKGIQVEKTAPITIFTPLTEDSPLPYSMALFLPPELALLKPSDDQVKLIALPASDLYVRSFSGPGERDDVQENLQALADTLVDQFKPFHASFFGFNIYNSQDDDNDNHNEVFFVAG